jgi:hypothetical protein
VEADLARTGDRLADLWSGRLSLWQVWARVVAHAPTESAIGHATGQADGWPLIAYLLTDIFEVIVGKPHPADPRAPRVKKHKAERAVRMRDELAAYDRERAVLLAKQRAAAADN